MNKRFTFIFPGQGAQSIGMGREFYEAYPQVKESFQRAEDILGRHLVKTLFEGPEDILNLTHNSQPALFVHSLALLEVLKREMPSIKPKYTLGLSLGEYSAFVAANVLPYEETLRTVDMRGKLMGEACVKNPGTMAVVMGLDSDVVEKIVKEASLPHDLWAANFNAPGQVVISGTLKGIEKGTELLKAANAKRVLPLQVQGAFHSGLMKPAEDALAPYIDALSINLGDIRVVMNVTADFAKDAAYVKNNLISQVTSPVRWSESITRIDPETDIFIEIGSGQTLKGLNKRIGVKGATYSLEKPQDLELIQKELG